MLNIPGAGQAESVLIALLAFSTLIFVHEFGHFIACRLIGVRVERFFIGFDAWGMAIKRKFGDTVYGIGVIPLGGYVKPAGQADDPRAQQVTGAPDELPSKPPWAQAVMFGAGVFMNFVFGFVLLVIAYLHGILFQPPILGRLVEKGPAQVHGLKPGDRVLEINGHKVRTFNQLSSTVFELSQQELLLKVERTAENGRRERFAVKIHTVRSQGTRGQIPYIGAEPPTTNEIGGIDSGLEFDAVRRALAPGDRILAVNGQAIGRYEGFRVQELVRDLPGAFITLRVRHRDQRVETVRLRCATYGFLDLGLRFPIRISKVSAGSPAAAAGLLAGDRVICMQTRTGKVYFKDHRHFNDLLSGYALRSLALTVLRKGRRMRLPGIKPAPMPGDPRMPADADTLLGVLAQPSSEPTGYRITRVLAHGPGNGRLQAGDVIVGAGGAPVSPARPLGAQVEAASSREAVLLVRRAGAPALLTFRVRPRIDPIHRRPLIGVIISPDPVVTRVEPSPFAPPGMLTAIHPGTRVLGMRLSYDLKTTTLLYQPRGEDDGRSIIFSTPKELAASLAARRRAGLRGILPLDMRPARELVAAAGITDALRMAAHSWLNMAGMIYTVIERLLTRKMTLDAVGGPVLLFRSIHMASAIGFGFVLYLVALISINLGVINLLPLPVLDGGHILFLLIGWIKGSPPSEKFKEYAQYVGLACILSLILTVTWFDLYYWLR